MTASISQEFDFLSAAEAVLQHVEHCCDALNDHKDIDIDNQRTGALLTLTFPNQSQIVINLQKPLEEIWLATSEGGFHFHYSNGFWIDTKTQSEFFHLLSQAASHQSGAPIAFTAPPAL